MPDIVTRCPACNIAFRAEPSQLSAATGLVRCGTCLKVFDAKEHQEKIIPDEINIDYLPYVLDGLEDLNDVTNHLEQQLNNTLSEKLEQEISHEIIDSALANNAENHSKFADMLDDLLDNSVSDQIKIPNPFSDDEAATKPIEQTTVRQKITMAGVLLLGSFVALIVWAYFNSESLSAKTIYRPALTVLCRYTQCPIAEYSEHNRIHISDFSVSTDQQQPNHINIKLLMVNQTASSQRFPGLDIVFSNQNQQPITKRTITPKEYLQSPLDSESLIKTNEKIHISIQVPNPGNAATNASVQISNSD
jgi:predicted Zn finger-like uncharacterized protein